MPDYFIDNPPMQPKREIAEYVESQGILVPRRFENFSEAKKSGVPIIARSEHPSEYIGINGYDAVSGLLYSPGPMLIKDITNEKELYEIVYDQNWQLQEFLSLIDESWDNFCAKLSFSYWEYIAGDNCTVVADSTIPERYHIMIHGKEGNQSGSNYFIIEDRKVINTFFDPEEFCFLRDFNRVIDFYENVRGLSKFDPNNCAIVEMQSGADVLYYLQTHRTNNFKPFNFFLDRELQDGEIEALVVRGATNHEGIEDFSLMWSPNPLNADWKINSFPTKIVSTKDADTMDQLLTLSSLDVKIKLAESIDDTLTQSVHNHNPRSILFKPMCTVVVDINDFYGENGLFSDEESIRFYDNAKAGSYQYAKLHVVSDGRRAIIKRID